MVLAEALRGRDAVTLGSAHGVLGSPVVLRPGQLLLPGFVDAHVHAPQFPNAGLGYDKTLLDWLESYTFPLEARYADQEFATRVYDAVVVRDKRGQGNGANEGSGWLTVGQTPV